MAPPRELLAYGGEGHGLHLPKQNQQTVQSATNFIRWDTTVAVGGVSLSLGMSLSAVLHEWGQGEAEREEVGEGGETGRLRRDEAKLNTNNDQGVCIEW